MNLWFVLTPPTPPLLLLLHHLPHCCPGWWWHMQQVMFSQLALHTSKGHRGVPFNVRGKNPLLGKAKLCMWVCEGVWNDGLLWGGHPWPSATQGVPVCVYLYNMWVCEVDNTLRWSPVPFLSRASACVFECVYCTREWWVLWGGHPGLPHVPWPMSSAGKQKAKCHEVKGREEKKGVQQLSKRGVYPAQRLTHEWKI